MAPLGEIPPADAVDPSDPIELELRSLGTAAGVHDVDDVALFRVSGDEARAWLGGVVAGDTDGLEAGSAMSTAVLDAHGERLIDAMVYDPGGDRIIGFDPGDRIIAVAATTASAVATSLLARIGRRDVNLRPADDLVIVRAAGPRAGDVASSVIVPSIGSFSTVRSGIAGRDWLVATQDHDAAYRELVHAAEALGGGAVSREAIARHVASSSL